MKPIQVGLVADPASPTEIAHRVSDLDPPDGQDRGAWDIEVVSEPFTTGCEDIDTAVQLGLAHPMGPLKLADLIGLDTVLHIGEVLCAAFGDARYEAPALLRELIDEGKLGRKAGFGFYDYG